MSIKVGFQRIDDNVGRRWVVIISAFRHTVLIASWRWMVYV